ncbi:MAG: ChaN family lipoprotein [Gammaproteobacteria bacterium]
MNSLQIVKNVKPSLKVLLCIVLIFQCSVSAKQPSHDWQAPFFQNHELVGKIWDTYKNAWLSTEQFENELLYYDYILLGEIHNHPDHHVLQARVINSLVASGKKPTVVMEMLSQQAWQEQPQQWSKADELQELASMLNDGWPWQLYAPILQSVVQHQLELFAGNVSSDELHRWSNERSNDNQIDLLSEYSYTADNFEVLKKNIVDSHCGHANQGFVSFMSRAQMQRDKIMAELLVEKELPVIFIAGSGHVRNDYAVPMQLRNNFAQNSYLTVAFVSVQEGEDDPQAYLQAVPDLYDMLYFTPGHTDQDPCEQFKKQLKNMQHRPTS